MAETRFLKRCGALCFNGIETMTLMDRNYHYAKPGNLDKSPISEAFEALLAKRPPAKDVDMVSQQDVFYQLLILRYAIIILLILIGVFAITYLVLY